MIQSDRHRFCEDVVFDSFNLANRDVDSILDQKYERKYLWIIIMKISNFEVIKENAYLNKYST